MFKNFKNFFKNKNSSSKYLANTNDQIDDILDNNRIKNILTEMNSNNKNIDLKDHKILKGYANADFDRLNNYTGVTMGKYIDIKSKDYKVKYDSLFDLDNAKELTNETNNNLKNKWNIIKESYKFNKYINKYSKVRVKKIEETIDNLKEFDKIIDIDNLSKNKFFKISITNFIKNPSKELNIFNNISQKNYKQIIELLDSNDFNSEKLIKLIKTFDEESINEIYSNVRKVIFFKGKPPDGIDNIDLELLKWNVRISNNIRFFYNNYLSETRGIKKLDPNDPDYNEKVKKINKEIELRKKKYKSFAIICGFGAIISISIFLQHIIVKDKKDSWLSQIEKSLDEKESFSNTVSSSPSDEDLSNINLDELFIILEQLENDEENIDYNTLVKIMIIHLIKTSKSNDEIDDKVNEKKSNDKNNEKIVEKNFFEKYKYYIIGIVSFIILLVIIILIL